MLVRVLGLGFFAFFMCFLLRQDFFPQCSLFSTLSGLFKMNRQWISHISLRRLFHSLIELTLPFFSSWHWANVFFLLLHPSAASYAPHWIIPWLFYALKINSFIILFLSHLAMLNIFNSYHHFSWVAFNPFRCFNFISLASLLNCVP